MSAESTSFQLPDYPAIVVANGDGTAEMYNDRFDGMSVDLPPIRRAVIVARLRALANVIEATS